MMIFSDRHAPLSLLFSSVFVVGDCFFVFHQIKRVDSFVSIKVFVEIFVVDNMKPQIILATNMNNLKGLLLKNNKMRPQLY